MRFVAAIFIFLLSHAGVSTADDRIYVCDDVVPWPPYTYPATETDEITPLGQTGAMVEFLDAVMRTAGLRYQLKLRPWKRCLNELQQHQLDEHSEIAMNASFSAEREELYYYTDAVYTTTRGIFYAKGAFPAGPNINTLDDLTEFRVCGVKGYNYQDVGLSNDELAATAGSLPLALTMLSKGRCDVLINSVEPIVGTKLIGTSIVPPGVTYKTTSLGAEPTTFHFVISRENPRGAELFGRLNSVIKRLIEDGTRDDIFERYRRLMNE